MEKETFNKAYYLAESLDACEDANYLFENGGLKETLGKSVSILAKNDEEFKGKLCELITETEKRLQKEFDEL